MDNARSSYLFTHRRISMQVNVIPDFERDLVSATAEHKSDVITPIKEEHAAPADHDANKQSLSLTPAYFIDGYFVEMCVCVFVCIFLRTEIQQLFCFHKFTSLARLQLPTWSTPPAPMVPHCCSRGCELQTGTSITKQ